MFVAFKDYNQDIRSPKRKPKSKPEATTSQRRRFQASSGDAAALVGRAAPGNGVVEDGFG